MKRALVGFVRGIGTLAWPWQVWIVLLVLANGVGPFLFLWRAETRPEALAVLGAGAVGMVAQLVVFRWRGFVRLLGIGHLIAWVPLLAWLVGRLDSVDRASLFGIWILAVIALDLLSLVIDVTDVMRYGAGDRAPALTIEDV